MQILVIIQLKENSLVKQETEFDPHVFEEAWSNFHEKLLCTGHVKLQVMSLVC